MNQADFANFNLSFVMYPSIEQVIELQVFYKTALLEWQFSILPLCNSKALQKILYMYILTQVSARMGTRMD